APGLAHLHHVLSVELVVGRAHVVGIGGLILVPVALVLGGELRVELLLQGGLLRRLAAGESQYGGGRIAGCGSTEGEDAGQGGAQHDQEFHGPRTTHGTTSRNREGWGKRS